MMEQTLLDRFLRYVRVETRSDETATTVPSTQSQTVFAQQLANELISLGVQDVHIHPVNGYVIGTIASNLTTTAPVVGFIAHMDTADFNAHDVQPQVVTNYDGQRDIPLDEAGQFVLSPTEFPALRRYTGHTLITTDGRTLLGADDKAGIAEIMTLAEYYHDHPEVAHGTIKIGFGPDEEIGTGADHFDVVDFGADFAYTVDGGPLGELEYETFNAAQAKIDIQGKEVHTATAKGVMVNALQVAMDLHDMLPKHDRPELTQDREGFFHLDALTGTVDHATMSYIIRDHDRQLFNHRKQQLEAIVTQLNTQLDQPRIQLTLTDQYYNMREVMDHHMEVVTLAKRAMEALKIQPVIYPVRGGTDGSKISFMGLPTPNLFAGGENMHSRYEFVSLQVMGQAVAVLQQISALTAQMSK